MKPLLSYAALAAAVLGLSSCCCLFGGLSNAEYSSVTKRVCGYDKVVQQVQVGGSKSGLTETVTTKVPRFKTVKKVAYCPFPVRFYCPGQGCGNVMGKNMPKLVSAQGWSGSPNIGLVPTMKPLAP